MDDRDILSQHFQDSIIKLMITSTEFIKITRAVVKDEYFTSKYARQFFHICTNFFDLHNEAPVNHFSDELKRLFQSNRQINETERKVYIEYAKRLQKHDPPTVSYVKTRLNEFVVTKCLEIGTVQAAEFLEEGKLSEAKESLYDALKSGIETVNNGQYYHDEQDLEARLEEGDINFLMPLGIPELDKVSGGLYRGRLTILAGLYGIGKSWLLVHLAKEALKRGLNVLHISHEMSEEELKCRYDQAFGALTSRPMLSIQVRRLDKKTGELYEKIIKRPSITNYKAAKRLRHLMKKMPGKLRIKKYPMSSATMIDIRNLLDQLESFDGFSPDLVLNDYPEIMADCVDVESTGINYRQHKRIADERGVAVVVPSQINDEMASLQCRVHLRHLSANKQKAGHADSVLAFGQSEQMQEQEQLFLQIIKARNSAIVGARCVVGTNFTTGQFRLYSMPFVPLRAVLDMGEDEEGDYE